MSCMCLDPLHGYSRIICMVILAYSGVIAKSFLYCIIPIINSIIILYYFSCLSWELFPTQTKKGSKREICNLTSSIIRSISILYDEFSSDYCSTVKSLTFKHGLIAWSIINLL